VDVVDRLALPLDVCKVRDHHSGRDIIIPVGEFSSGFNKIPEQYITLPHSHPLDLTLNRTNTAHICYLSSFYARL
jgi:hypothetical protein